MIQVCIQDEIFWIEKENGKTVFLRIQRPTHVMQQCQVTTRQKAANCWREHGLCGEHAALMFPEKYPKAKGHPTGGRHGLEKNNSFLKMEEPIVIKS